MSIDVLRARDVMSTDVMTTSPDASVSSMFETVVEHPSHCVLIVDEGRGIVGIVTEGDIFWTLLVAHPPRGPLLIEILKNVDAMMAYLEQESKARSGRARDIMSSPVVVVNSDDPLTAAIAPMTIKGFRQIPVVENGRLLGTLYRSQVLKAMTRLSPSHENTWE